MTSQNWTRHGHQDTAAYDVLAAADAAYAAQRSKRKKKHINATFFRHIKAKTPIICSILNRTITKHGYLRCSYSAFKKHLDGVFSKRGGAFRPDLAAFKTPPKPSWLVTTSHRPPKNRSRMTWWRRDTRQFPLAVGILQPMRATSLHVWLLPALRPTNI